MKRVSVAVANPSTFKQKDFFTLLDLPFAYEVDLAKLEKNYFSLQSQFHPDRFATKSSSEKIAALQAATNINNAYKILKSPLKRAEYILQINGTDMPEPAQEVLMESMQQREELSEAGDIKELESLAEAAENNRQEVIENINISFTSGDYDSAAKEVIKLKYAEKLIDEIRLKKKKLT